MDQKLIDFFSSLIHMGSCTAPPPYSYYYLCLADE